MPMRNLWWLPHRHRHAVEFLPGRTASDGQLLHSLGSEATSSNGPRPAGTSAAQMSASSVQVQAAVDAADHSHVPAGLASAVSPKSAASPRHAAEPSSATVLSSGGQQRRSQHRPQLLTRFVPPAFLLAFLLASPPAASQFIQNCVRIPSGHRGSFSLYFPCLLSHPAMLRKTSGNHLCPWRSTKLWARPASLHTVDWVQRALPHRVEAPR